MVFPAGRCTGPANTPLNPEFTASSEQHTTYDMTNTITVRDI